MQGHFCYYIINDVTDTILILIQTTYTLVYQNTYLLRSPTKAFMISWKYEWLH